MWLYLKPLRTSKFYSLMKSAAKFTGFVETASIKNLKLLPTVSKIVSNEENELETVCADKSLTEPETIIIILPFQTAWMSNIRSISITSKFGFPANSIIVKNRLSKAP